MNKSLIIFLITLVAAIGFNMVWGLSNNMLETPEYELIKKSGSFEIRKYAPMVVARTQVSSDYSEATSRGFCLLYTSPSPRDLSTSRMPSSA